LASAAPLALSLNVHSAQKGHYHKEAALAPESQSITQRLLTVVEAGLVMPRYKYTARQSVSCQAFGLMHSHAVGRGGVILNVNDWLERLSVTDFM
jgi:hypothetical protein